jgi:hypothetical protein
LEDDLNFEIRSRTAGQCLAAVAILAGAPVSSASAQEPLPGSRISNAGVFRADSAVEAVFLARTRLVDTVDIGDFASHLLARLGVPPFPDSLKFAVTSDSARVRIVGRLGVLDRYCVV